MGPSTLNSSLGYYGTTPESPDGKRIVFTVFLNQTRESRRETVASELWVCDHNLTNGRKVTDLKPIETHNGARAQWLDNETLLYQDQAIYVVNLEGERLMGPLEGKIGHHPHAGKFLLGAFDPDTKLFSMFEGDYKTGSLLKMVDVTHFSDLLNHFQDESYLPVEKWNFLHLQYSPNGSHIALRLNIGPRGELFNHLVTMKTDGSDVICFGPKPMHFQWFDNETIMGHDNQVNDGQPNDHSLRRWKRDGTFVETLAGPGNHLGASDDRNYFASETWYKSDPVLLSIYAKNQMEPLWQEEASTDPHSTWTLAYHTNPAFSRDGKHLYFNKCVAPGKVQVYRVKRPAQE